MTTTRRAPVLLALLAVVPALTGCGPGSGTDEGRAPDPAPTSGPPQTPQTSETSETPGSPPPATSTPPALPPRQGAEGTAVGMVLTDVRGSADRVVLEFRGRGTPGWQAGYSEAARLEGSGEVVDLGGDAVLDVQVPGSTWPAPGYYSGPTRLRPPAAGPVSEVYVEGTFEGWTRVLVGVEDEPTAFRARALTSPPRVVVDLLG